MSRSKKLPKTPEQLLLSLQERQRTAEREARTCGIVAGIAFLATFGILLAGLCGYSLGSNVFSTDLGNATFSVALANVTGLISTRYCWNRLKLRKSMASRAHQISRLVSEGVQAAESANAAGYAKERVSDS